MENNLSENSAYCGSFGGKTTKIDRYKWIIKNKQGELKWLNKDSLAVDESYQRSASRAKVLRIAREWSWIACGVISVAKRASGFFVIDGQHRVLAARNRADIDDLPCVVFDSDGAEKEARAFLDTNKNRKAMTSIESFKAMTIAMEPVAIFVKETLEKNSITISTSASRPLEFKSLTFAIKTAKEAPEIFVELFDLIGKLCVACPIRERVAGGLFYLAKKGFFQKKGFKDRVLKIGHEALFQAANKAAAYFAAGGEKVWASGILDTINKSLRVKFELEAI